MQWLSQIHEKNPYEGFPLAKYQPDLQGWGHDSKIFEHMIVTYRPQIVVEVGTWKGATANKMASLLKQHGVPDPQLICIDTWLGSAENWLLRQHPDFFPSLKLQWGRPSVYNQFMANVLFSDNADVIVPFPVNSLTAARFLFTKGFAADAIYIDAGHDYEDVLADISAFWRLVRAGGVIFGDNYVLGWVGVVRAVHDFADSQHLMVDTSFDHKWILQKPRAAQQGQNLEGGFTAANASIHEFPKPMRKAGDSEPSQNTVGQANRSRFPMFVQPNLALNRKATQSSVSSWSRHQDPIEDARGGNNGIITGLYGFHTDLEDNPWWTVELDEVQPVAYIVIYNRIDDGLARRAEQITIELSVDGEDWKTVHLPTRYFGGADGRPLSIHLDPALPARFVRLTLRDRNYLHMDEIEVYGPGPAPTLPKKINWLNVIHQANPYMGFPIEEYHEDAQGWGFESPIFDHVVDRYRPHIIVEVGTWKGASANRMAGLLKKRNFFDAQIVCIDTWLGSVENWRAGHVASVPMKWGRPELYNQFIANVLFSNNADMIVPFPVNSLAAARFLAEKGLSADAIYIDAGHDYEDALSDLRAYWKLVRPGGVIFGDDYILGWIGVVRAVHDFAEEHELAIDTSFYHKWLIEKR